VPPPPPHSQTARLLVKRIKQDSLGPGSEMSSGFRSLVHAFIFAVPTLLMAQGEEETGMERLLD
jgi:hypothetical protein